MNVSSRLLIIIALVFGLWGGFGKAALAQMDTGSSTSSSSSGTRTNIDIPDSFSNYFYIDQLGIDLAQSATPYETSIDTSIFKLGPNDVITVDISGNLSMLLRGVIVNAQGDLVLPKIGTIKVSGLTINQAERKINKAAKEQFKNFHLKITLDKPRLFHIYVSGEVPNPGKYMVPAQTRVAQAIYPAIQGSGVKEGEEEQQAQQSNRTGQTQYPLKGLQSTTARVTRQLNQQESSNTSRQSIELKQDVLENTQFSLRHIAITHQDSTQDTADLVAFYASGNLSANPRVRDGDRITIYKLSQWTPRVSISGGVKSQMELQYLKTDTPERLIHIAGDYQNDADTSKVLVFRKESDRIKKITVQQSALDKFTLEPNDRVVVPINREHRQSESAWIYGEAQNPGNYPIYDGQTTVSDLLEMAGGLSNRALPQGAYLIRSQSQYSNDKANEKQAPGKINEKLLKRSSDQTIQGFEYLDLESDVSEGKVYVDLSDKKQLAQVKVYDGDELYIPRDEKTIFVFGQVKQPGYYTYQPEKGKSAIDYIQQAGGFTVPAQKNRVFIIKAGTKTWIKPDNTEIESGDMVFVDRTPYEDIETKRTYKLDKMRLILSGISTVTGIITAYIAITR